MAYGVISPKNNKTYYLHSMTRNVHNKLIKFYFFAGTITEETSENKLPEGYEVVFNAKSVLPVLKKIKVEN